MAQLVALLHIRGIHTAVVSNKADQMAKQIVKALFSQDVFDEVAGMKEGIAPKPNPEALLNICRTWKVEPQECVMVGDSNVDILTGDNAGMVSVGVAWGFRGRAELELSLIHI